MASETPFTDFQPAPPSISHLDHVSYLFGYPIAHSLSPLLHSTVFAGLQLKKREYLLYESLSIPSFLALTKDPKFFGAAVTMPHKVAIIPHLHALTPEGKAIGAINTIFLQTGPNNERQLIGTNTDCIGVREALRQNVSPETYASWKGKPALVVGGGGTSRAAVYTLKNFLGCSPIYMINRDKSEVDAVIAECTAAGFGDNLIYISSAAHAASLTGPAVVVSAVPDFPPKSESEIAARQELEILLAAAEVKGALLEMCYHPSPNTEIDALARKAGWQVVPGTEAMIWQGLEQDHFWTGKEVKEMPVADVKRVVKEALAKPSH